MTIRYAVTADVPALSAVEAECFPPAEVATAAEFAERVAYYGNHFWLMYSRLHAGRAYRSTGDFGHPGCIIGSGSNRIYR